MQTNKLVVSGNLAHRDRNRAGLENQLNLFDFILQVTLIRRAYAAAAHGQVRGVAAGDNAAGVVDQYRNIDINTNRFSHLTGFARHGNGGQQEDQAVNPPADVQRDNVRV